MGFDPDTYLGGGTPAFDPDKYLGEFNPDSYLAEQPAGVTTTAKTTGYHPVSPDSPDYKMEGGNVDKMGKPIFTLDQYRRGEAPFVTIAGDPAIPYGTPATSPHFPGVPFMVNDTGSAFKGAGLSHFDIARDTAEGANSDENNQQVQFDLANPNFALPQQQDQPQAALPQESEAAQPITAQQILGQPEQQALPPSWFHNAIEGLKETGSELVPHSVPELAQFLTPLASLPAEAKKTYGMVHDLIEGVPIADAEQKNFSESQLIADAQKTPPLSKERFHAGFSTLAKFGLLAAGAKGLARGAHTTDDFKATTKGGEKVNEQGRIEVPNQGTGGSPESAQGSARQTGQGLAGGEADQGTQSSGSRGDREAQQGSRGTTPPDRRSAGYPSGPEPATGLPADRGSATPADQLAGGQSALTPQGPLTFQPFAELPSVQEGLPEGFASVGASTGVDIPAPSVTSIKNAVVDQARAKKGWLPLFEPARKANPGTWDVAMERIEENPALGEQMVDDIRAGRKDSVSDVEQAILLHEQIRVNNERLQESERAVDPHSSEDDRFFHLARFSALEDRMNEIDQATQAAGTMAGRALQIRKLMANDDYTLAAMEARTRLAKGGEALEHEEAVRVKKDAEDIAKKEKDAGKVEAKRDESASMEGVKAQIEKAKRKPKGPADLPAEREALLGGIRGRLEAGEKRQQLQKLIQRLAENYVLDGITNRDNLVQAVTIDLKKIIPDMTFRETADAISGYGDYKPLNPDVIKAKLRDIKGQLQQVAKIQSMLEKEAPKKTGVERRTPSDIERRLTKSVNELKKEGGWNVTDPAKQLKSALEGVKTRLRHQISDLEHQIATKTKIVDKRGSVLLDPEAEALKQRRDELKVQFGEIFGKPEMTDAQRLNLAVKTVQRGIAEYQRRITEGDFARKGSVTPLTPELTKMRAERDRLRDEYKSLEATAHPERATEAALRTFKTRLNNLADNYETKLARGDFEPPPAKPKLALDKEAETARFRAEKAKRDFNSELLKYKLKALPLPQKMWRNASEVANFIKAIRSSVDLSAVRRQGGMLVSAHPKLAAESFGPMFKALRSEASELALQNEMMAHPRYQMWVKAGLQITKEDTASISQMEEQFMSRWARHTPLVAGSERAYVTFLNQIRFKAANTLYDSVSRSWFKKGNVTDAEAKAVANFVNKATGRGSFGTKDAVTGGLSTVFWSPRLVASRFQLLLGQPFYRGSLRTRSLIAQEYGRMLIGQSVYYGLLTAAFTALGKQVSFSTDRKSSDYLKIRIGDTRIDPFFGMIQPTVLLSRLISGEKTTGGGKTVSITGDNIPYGSGDTTDLLKDFARTKLAPVPALALDIRNGKDFVGNPVTPLSVLGNVLPLTLGDIYSEMKQEGVPTGTALGLVSTFGDGVNVYSKRVHPGGSTKIKMEPAF